VLIVAGNNPGLTVVELVKQLLDSTREDPKNPIVRIRVQGRDYGLDRRYFYREAEFLVIDLETI
jgi:hypothetical protein